MDQTTENTGTPIEGWRLKLGIAVFALSIAVPVVGIPLVTGADLPGSMAASVSGALLIGAEVLGIAAIAIMGKPGFVYIKGKVLRVLRRIVPREEVGRTRYHVGLVMFSIPVAAGWLYPYVRSWIPAVEADPVPYAVALDLLTLASLFVLGGDFWDKVRALFVHGDRIHRGGDDGA